MSSPFSFSLPLELSAKEPERRGIARDQVRLMIIDRANYQVEHTRFDHLGEYVRPGDLLSSIRVAHFLLHSTAVSYQPDHVWRFAWRNISQMIPGWRCFCVKGATFLLWSSGGMQINFGQGLTGTVYDHDQNIPRLWKLRFEIGNRAHRSALPSRTTNPI